MKTVRVDWPIGPELGELDELDARAWVRFKLLSSDWYLERLGEVIKAVDRIQHQVGIEMAIDGVLQSLSSAVDAACAAVIRAVEIKEETTPLEEHKYDRRIALKSLRRVGQKGAAEELRLALEAPKDGPPTGWLAQMSYLRNTVAHRSALTRTHYVGGEHHGQTHLDIAGLGTQEPMPYLHYVRSMTEALTTTLLGAATAVAPNTSLLPFRTSANVTVASVGVTVLAPAGRVVFGPPPRP